MENHLDIVTVQNQWNKSFLFRNYFCRQRQRLKKKNQHVLYFRSRRFEDIKYDTERGCCDKVRKSAASAHKQHKAASAKSTKIRCFFSSKLQALVKYWSSTAESQAGHIPGRPNIGMVGLLDVRADAPVSLRGGSRGAQCVGIHPPIIIFISGLFSCNISKTKTFHGRFFEKK